MLKTYRIIPSTFILFLFGLTLITVSPVFAEDSPEFMACQQLGNAGGNFKLMEQKKNCFRDVVLSLLGELDLENPKFIACKQIQPQGNFQLMEQKKNCFRDVARLFQEEFGASMQPGTLIEISEDQIAVWNNRIAELEGQLSAATPSQGPLNARVAELEGQLTEATAAQGPLNARVAELEEQFADANAAYTSKSKELRDYVDSAKSNQKSTEEKLEKQEWLGRQLRHEIGNLKKEIAREKTYTEKYEKERDDYYTKYRKERMNVRAACGSHVFRSGHKNAYKNRWCMNFAGEYFK